MSQGERVKRVWQAFGAFSNEDKSMYTSPKRMILTKEGRVVEAGPGVSGNLIVAEGGQIPEDMARKYGLLPPPDASKNKPLVAPIIVRGPEGAVSVTPGENSSVALEPNDPAKTTGEGEGTQDQTTDAPTGEVAKPWEGQPSPPSDPNQSLTSHPIVGAEGGALKVD